MMCEQVLLFARNSSAPTGDVLIAGTEVNETLALEPSGSLPEAAGTASWEPRAHTLSDPDGMLIFLSAPRIFIVLHVHLILGNFLRILFRRCICTEHVITGGE